MLETTGYLLALFILFNGDVTFPIYAPVEHLAGETPQMMQANEDIRYQLSGEEKTFVKKLNIPEKDERIYKHAIMLYSSNKTSIFKLHIAYAEARCICARPHRSEFQ